MPDQRFYVYIVESPSSRDLLDHGLEGRVLTQALSLSEIDSFYHVAADQTAFNECLNTRLDTTMRNDSYLRFPILHLSAHGSDQGIQLTNREFVPWQQLRDRLSQLNALFGSTLIICVSACYGAFAAQLGMTDVKPPFYALISPSTSVSLSDLAIAYSSFYHILKKTWNLTAAHQAMKTASGNNDFAIYFAAQLRRSYEDWKFRQQVQVSMAKLQEQQTSG